MLRKLCNGPLASLTLAYSCITAAQKLFNACNCVAWRAILHKRLSRHAKVSALQHLHDEADDTVLKLILQRTHPVGDDLRPGMCALLAGRMTVQSHHLNCPCQVCQST